MYMIGLPFLRLALGHPRSLRLLSQHKNKKADAAEHPKVFDRVGLLVYQPPAMRGLLSI